MCVKCSLSTLVTFYALIFGRLEYRSVFSYLRILLSRVSIISCVIDINYSKNSSEAAIHHDGASLLIEVFYINSSFKVLLQFQIYSKHLSVFQSSCPQRRLPTISVPHVRPTSPRRIFFRAINNESFIKPMHQDTKSTLTVNNA